MKKLVLNLLVTLARAIIKQYRPRVVGITGSVGKTTTKEAVFHVLSKNFRTARSLKNANTEWGITATIIEPSFVPTETRSGKAKITPVQTLYLIGQGLKRLLVTTTYPEVLVLELAADRPGDIKFFNQFLKYDVAVITNIGQVHLEFYANQDRLTQEKLAITHQLKANGLVIINGDSSLTQDWIDHASLRKSTFGWEDDNDFYATLADVTANDTRFTLHSPNDEITLQFPFGRQVVLAAIVAVAVGREFGLDLDDVASHLLSFAPLPKRFEIAKLKRGITLINDAYNANPDSMKLALISLQDLAKGRRVAILGGMKELGEAHESAHLLVGRSVSDKVDLLIAVGDDGQLIANGASQGGLEDSKIKLIRWSDSLNVDEIFPLLRNNDTVLVKASRDIGLDKVAKGLMNELS